MSYWHIDTKYIKSVVIGIVVDEIIDDSKFSAVYTFYNFLHTTNNSDS